MLRILLRRWNAALLLAARGVLPLGVISASGAHLQFNFQDFVGGSITSAPVRISPLSTPTVSGSGIVHNEPRNTNTASGTIYVSNVVAGGYSVEVRTPIKPTTFTILVPSTNVLLDASTLLVVATNVVTYNTTNLVYTAAAADGRFVPRVSGWSTGQTLSNAAFAGSTNFFTVPTNRVVQGSTFAAIDTNGNVSARSVDVVSRLWASGTVPFSGTPAMGTIFAPSGALGSLQTPANFFSQFKRVRIQARGTLGFVNGSTITIRVMVGSAYTDLVFTAGNIASDTVVCTMEITLPCYASGASGSFLPFLEFRANKDTSSWSRQVQGSITANTTIANTLDVQLLTGNAGDAIQFNDVFVEWIP